MSSFTFFAYIGTTFSPRNFELSFKFLEIVYNFFNVRAPFSSQKNQTKSALIHFKEQF